MRLKYSRYSMTILLCLINGIFGHALIDSRSAAQNNVIQELPMKAELVLTIGSDKKNEDFFRPESVAIDREGKIFILDSRNSRIQCFSAEGKYLFSFGKAGQGPGELSKRSTKIKYLEDGNIYVIDNDSLRINVYDTNGKFKFQGKIKTFYDDIIMIDNKYYLSSSILKEKYVPIHVMNKFGEVSKSFGLFIEPSTGLLKEILEKTNNNPAGFDMNFAWGGWSFLITNSKKEIIHSQRLPYRIIKYSQEGQLIKDMQGQVEYDTQHRYKFVLDGNLGGIEEILPSPYFFTPKVNKDDSIMIPFLNPEKDYLYIDIYDKDINFISRYKAPLLLLDYKKKDRIQHVHIDENNNIYFLIAFEDKPAQLFKYKLTF